MGGGWLNLVPGTPGNHLRFDRRHLYVTKFLTVDVRFKAFLRFLQKIESHALGAKYSNNNILLILDCDSGPCRTCTSKYKDKSKSKDHDICMGYGTPIHTVR